ncbi:MAG TPA: hypothetical protein EYG38_08985, partial [Verrucomicrobia bacterium]|nr:hypothetical protein [Verrucomicrobiota bacterium]
MAKKVTCTILKTGESENHLWYFNSSNGKASLNGERRFSLEQKLPDKWVRKNWTHLWKKSVNLAWFPSDQVYLKVIQIPTDNRTEARSMIDLLLEKISPFPVNQIVWTFELIPGLNHELHSAIVIIAATQKVDTLIDELEDRGFIPDRLELSLMEQILSLKIEHDGAYIIPGIVDGRKSCVITWWNQGILVNVNLIPLPDSGDWVEYLLNKIKEASWAGEMEGWLNLDSLWTIVVDESTRDDWQPLIDQLPNQSTLCIAPLSDTELSTRAARNTTGNQERDDLLPEDYRNRNKQRFIDRIWISSLGVTIALYLMGVFIFYGINQFRDMNFRSMDKRIAELKPQFEKSKRTQEEIHLIQNQINLKKAGIDTLTTMSELLPASLQLTSFRLSKGETLTLRGTVPSSKLEEVDKFNESMSLHTY